MVQSQSAQPEGAGARTPSLTVHVFDTGSGERRSYTFERSPVRLGRSPLNDLPLSYGSVSHCHGVLRFGEDGCSYLDLGSTNGSKLNGTQLPQGVAEPLPDGSILSVGAVQLELTLSQRRVSGTRESYAFSPGALPMGPEIAGRPPADGASPLPLPPELLRAAEAQRAARSALRAQLAATLDGLAPPGRQQLLAALEASFPDLREDPALRTLAHQPQCDAAGEGENRREAILLDRFVRAFVELRRGRAHLLRQLGLGATDQSCPLRDFEEPESLLTFLLDPADESRALDALSRAFADLMLHEVAFLSAVTVGARELLSELFPARLAHRSSRVPAWLARFASARSTLRVISERRRELAEESALTAALFGRGFRRAYHRTFGSKNTTRSQSYAPAGERP